MAYQYDASGHAWDSNLQRYIDGMGHSLNPATGEWEGGGPVDAQKNAPPPAGVAGPNAVPQRGVGTPPGGTPPGALPPTPTAPGSVNPMTNAPLPTGSAARTKEEWITLRTIALQASYMYGEGPSSLPGVPASYYGILKIGSPNYNANFQPTTQLYDAIFGPVAQQEYAAAGLNLPSMPQQNPAVMQINANAAQQAGINDTSKANNTATNAANIEQAKIQAGASTANAATNAAAQTEAARIAAGASTTNTQTTTQAQRDIAAANNANALALQAQADAARLQQIAAQTKSAADIAAANNATQKAIAEADNAARLAIAAGQNATQQAIAAGGWGNDQILANLNNAAALQRQQGQNATQQAIANLQESGLDRRTAQDLASRMSIAQLQEAGQSARNAAQIAAQLQVANIQSGDTRYGVDVRAQTDLSGQQSQERIATANRGESARQFDITTAQQAHQFDVTTAEGARQFNTSTLVSLLDKGIQLAQKPVDWIGYQYFMNNVGIPMNAITANAATSLFGAIPPSGPSASGPNTGGPGVVFGDTSHAQQMGVQPQFVSVGDAVKANPGSPSDPLSGNMSAAAKYPQWVQQAGGAQQLENKVAAARVQEVVPHLQASGSAEGQQLAQSAHQAMAANPPALRAPSGPTLPQIPGAPAPTPSPASGAMGQASSPVTGQAAAPAPLAPSPMAAPSLPKPQMSLPPIPGAQPPQAAPPPQPFGGMAAQAIPAAQGAPMVAPPQQQPQQPKPDLLTILKGIPSPQQAAPQQQPPVPVG